MKTILFLIPLIFFSCQEKTKFDIKKETQLILALDTENRQQHFEKNAKDFVAGFSKEFLSVNKGRIESPTPEENFQRFDGYFKSVRFLKWDNVKPPLVRFSDDGSVGYAAIDKLVVLEYTDPSGKKILDTTQFAWLAVYKKESNQWKLDCIASTDK